MPGHGPVVRLGRAFGDADHVRDPAAPLGACCAVVCAAPDRSEDIASVHVSTRPCPARTAKGRSSRATPASPDRRGSPAPAGSRSAPDCPSSPAESAPPPAAVHSRRAWTPWAGGRAHQHRPARCWPGSHADPALRRKSRLIVEGDRSSRRAISRTPRPAARPTAISSRSANDKYRQQGSRTIVGITPPA